MAHKKKPAPELTPEEIKRAARAAENELDDEDKVPRRKRGTRIAGKDEEE